MQVITIDGVRNSDGKTARIGVIGSCRVHGPIKALVAGGRARAVAFPFNTYTHSPQDALQYLRFCQGQMVLPPALEPLVFGRAGMRYPALGFMQLVAGLDLIIAEVSSQTRLTAAGFEMQQNYFATNFVRSGGKPYLDWWRSVVRQDIGQQAVAAHLIESEQVTDLWKREVIQTAALNEIDETEFEAAMSTLVGAHAARWLFVSHFNFSAEKPVASRDRNIALLGKYAARAGVGFFDPSPFVIEAGAKAALKGGGKDTYHYDPAFEPVMGARLADAATTILSGGHDNVPRRIVSVVDRAPDRTLLGLKTSKELQDQIVESKNAGEVSMASALQHRLLEIEPADSDLVVAVAHSAAALGHWRSVIVYAEHLLSLDGGNVEARQLRVRALDALGEGDPVEAFAELVSAGDLGEVGEFCRRALRQYPPGSDVRQRIREAVEVARQRYDDSLDQQDNVASADALDQLISLDTDNAGQWISTRHGLVQEIMVAVQKAAGAGENDQALSLSRVLVRIGGNVAESNLLIGRIQLERGEVAEAIAALEAVATQQPERAWAQVNLARAHMRAGDIVASAEAYVNARELAAVSHEPALDEESRVALRSMASALVLKAREIEAKAVSPADDPEAFRIYTLAASALADEGDIDVLTAALRRRSLLRVVDMDKAASGDLPAAIAVHLSINPGCTRVLQIAGHHYMRVRDYEHALTYWEQLVALEPQIARHHLQVARCMDWMGMTGGMLTAAADCLALDPDNQEAQALAAKSTATIAELE
jgi:tetratricopeptide (TPR) repeat protein